MVKATGRTGTAAKADRFNCLWLALGYLAGKRGNRADLTPGDSVPIEIEVNAKFGRSKVTDTINGALQLGHGTQASSSSAAPADHVAALLLKELGNDDAQAAVMAKIGEAFKLNGMLPAVDAAARARAEVWLKRLRSSATINKSGSLLFVINGAQD